MIKILKIDQTGNWDKEFLAKYRISRMFGVYIFDSATIVHAAELAGSFECHFVESQPDYPDTLSDKDHGEMLDQIMEADSQTENIAYYHVSDVEQMVPFRRGFFPPQNKSGVVSIRGGWSRESMSNQEEDGRRTELIEEALEWCRQNSV